MRTNSLAGLSFLGLILVGCFSSDDPPLGPREIQNHQLTQRIADVEAQVSSLRELRFIRRIHSAIITREEYTQQLQAGLQHWMSDAEDAAYSRELAQMGFFEDTLLSYRKQ